MTLSEYISIIKDKRITVIGIGVSNIPLIKKLAENGCSVTACDRRAKNDIAVAAELEHMGVKLSLGETYLDDIQADIIFRTPGIRPDLPQIAAAVDSGIFKASTCVLCDGIYTYYDDYQPKCWIYPGVHGDVNAAYSLQVSCNCYFYELGRLMGIDKMNEYCKSYGLGEYTGIELGERRGILAGPAYRENNGLTAWTAGNTIAAAIGQSDNSLTPIQISNYISTVLNGGTRYSMHLLKEVREYGEDGKVVYEQKSEIVDQNALSKAAVEAAMK